MMLMRGEWEGVKCGHGCYLKCSIATTQCRDRKLRHINIKEDMEGTSESNCPVFPSLII